MLEFLSNEIARIPWSSNAPDGGAVAPSSVTARIYKDGSLTEITTGITNTSSWDALTGLNMIEIDVTAAGLTPGSIYQVMVEATISGVTARKWLERFTIEREMNVVSFGQLTAGGASSFTLPAGQRTKVKAGDVIELLMGTGAGARLILTYNAGTGAGTVAAFDTTPVAGDYFRVTRMATQEPLAAADFAAGAITALQAGLATAANLATANAGIADTQARLPASLIGGKMNSDTQAIAAAVITAIQAGLATGASQTTIASYIDTEIANIQSRLPAALVGGKMDSTAVATVDTTAIANAVFAVLIESGLPFKDLMRLVGAVLLGKTTGVGGLVSTFTSADVAGGVVVGSKVRITATRESDSDRLTLTVDAT